MPTQLLRNALALNLLWIHVVSYVAAQSASAKREGRRWQPASTRSQSSATPQVPNERKLGGIHPGSISGNIYTNPFFGFSLEIPEGWKVADSVVAQAEAEKH